MNKGLEVWKRLNEHDSNDESYWYGEQFGKDKVIIEKELNDYEEIKKNIIK